MDLLLGQLCILDSDAAHLHLISDASHIHFLLLFVRQACIYGY